MKKGFKVIILVVALMLTIIPAKSVIAQTQVGVKTNTITNVHTKVNYSVYIQKAATHETVDEFKYETKEVDFDTNSEQVKELEDEAEAKYKEWFSNKDYTFANQRASSYAIDFKEGKAHDEIIRHSDGTVTVITYKEVYKTIIISETYYIDEEEMLKGDLNGDGKVDADDAAEAIELFKTQSATDEDKLIGDMNEDGKIDAEDAALIIEYFKTHK